MRGASHVADGTPCQDASEVCTDPSGHWAISVVCDGAGSAKRSEEGASAVSVAFRSALLQLAEKLDTHEPGTWITDFIVQKILDTRAELRSLANEDNIAEFNSTLVACLLSPTGGFSVHIGDGAIFGENAEGLLEVISPPENGEYANETFFVTEPHWIRHLRVTPIKPMRWLSLCTDGGAALTMNNEDGVKTGFVYPVLREICSTHNSAAKNEILQRLLSDPKADAVTTDDKTVVIVMTSSLKSIDIIEPAEFAPAPRTEESTQSASRTFPIAASPPDKNNKIDQIQKPSIPGGLIPSRVSKKSGLIGLFRNGQEIPNLIIIVLITAFILIGTAAIFLLFRSDQGPRAPSELEPQSTITLEEEPPQNSVRGKVKLNGSEKSGESIHTSAKKQNDRPSEKSSIPAELVLESRGRLESTPADKNGDAPGSRLPISEQPGTQIEGKKASTPPYGSKTKIFINNSSFGERNPKKVEGNSAGSSTSVAPKTRLDKGSRTK